ncbi:hypothetical protein OQA88_6085 [Cercophora sp. LCS_1]
MVRPSCLWATAALAASALSSPVDLPPIEFDFVDWWIKQSFACPLWKGELPIGFRDLAGSTCSNILTKTFIQGTMTTRLYQIPGAWQSDARYSSIVNGAGEAIKKGLATFNSFAGPLTINIGFAWGGLGDRVQIDDDNTDVRDPCYILINYPASWVEIPLVALQKDIIMRMYQCVEQYHKPGITTWTDGNEWWRRGIARYVDGLSYPANSAMMTWGKYPEEYHYGIPLYQNEETAALFFHFAQQAGWSPGDVNNWMKGHANKVKYDEERRALSTDPKITSSLWHKFILASVDGAIKYASGQKIGNTQGGPPKKTYAVVALANGQNWSKTVSIPAFMGGSHVFPVKGGQTVRVSMETEPGVEWSIRKVGTAAWGSGDRARSVDVSVPAGSDANYEIVVSSTRDDAGSYYGKVKMARFA